MGTVLSGGMGGLVGAKRMGGTTGVLVGGSAGVLIGGTILHRLVSGRPTRLRSQKGGNQGPLPLSLSLAPHRGRRRTPEAICEALLQGGEDWAEGRPQDDDITLVVLKAK